MMKHALWIWGSAALLGAAFLGWYGGLRGPLTQEETKHYVALLEKQAGVDARQLAWFRELAETDDGEEVYILNLVQLRERPLAAPGVAAGESSQRVLERYTSDFIPRLFPRAGHPLLAGTPLLPIDQWGIAEDQEHWSSVVVIRHRSRRDLLEVATAPGTEGNHPYKVAALEKTLALTFDPSLAVVGVRTTAVFALLAAAGIAHAALALRQRRAAR